MRTTVFDDWADDSTETVDPGELTSRLAALHENEEVNLPAKGSTRRARIEKMQDELNELRQFVEDCDRYDEQTRDVQLVGSDVRRMMTAHLTKMRSRAIDRGRQVNAELQFVKGQTQ